LFIFSLRGPGHTSPSVGRSRKATSNQLPVDKRIGLDGKTAGKLNPQIPHARPDVLNRIVDNAPVALALGGTAFSYWDVMPADCWMILSGISGGIFLGQSPKFR
jgi:hypothetical protein